MVIGHGDIVYLDKPTHLLPVHCQHVIGTVAGPRPGAFNVDRSVT